MGLQKFPPSLEYLSSIGDTPCSSVWPHPQGLSFFSPAVCCSFVLLEGFVGSRREKDLSCVYPGKAGMSTFPSGSNSLLEAPGTG